MAETKKHAYDESKIKTLSSLEHIRLRTGMYIGRIGDGSHYDDGCYILLKEVIDNGIDEFIMGFGKEVKIDTFVVPATSEIAHGLKTETLNGQTLEEVFLSAGAKIGQPSCAACLGGPSDTFGRLNEPLSCISTTNRNFPGRMGHKEARVYLASPLTVAASAVTGVITDPREYLE